jgi:hypothetical protein
MSRGPVPDKPAARPTVPEVVALARAYWAKPGNGAGGALHIFLEDGNVDDASVRFCIEYARQRRDEDGVVLAEKLLAMSRTQRKRVNAQAYPPRAE